MPEVHPSGMFFIKLCRVCTVETEKQGIEDNHSVYSPNGNTRDGIVRRGSVGRKCAGEFWNLMMISKD
jgi:hypothetical protein